MNAADDKAARLIDRLAERVGAPQPPADLAARSRQRLRVGPVAILAILAVALAAGAALLSPRHHAGTATVAATEAAGEAVRQVSARVIVDRLRLHGRDARAEVTDLPRAGAVMVTARTQPASLGGMAPGLFAEAWAGEEPSDRGSPLVPANPPAYYADAEPTYHVRILRALMSPAPSGSALFGTREFVIPLSERERWGRADQSEALRLALGAARIEALPGVVIRSGSAEDGGPHRFETALGETLVDLAFEAGPIGGGWHRVRLTAAGPGLPDGDLLDTEIRIADGATVAVAAPLDGEGDTLIIGVTPLAAGPPEDFGKVSRVDLADVTPPALRERSMPIYPQKARDEGLTGKVIMEVVLRKDGTPDRLVVLRMPEKGEWLAGAAAEAVSKWRWDPARRGGEPIDVYMTLVVDFRLK
jgi:TonB family protein